MKKMLLSVLLICFIAGTSLDALAASTAYNSQIGVAINKYKMRNYVGCIQDLQMISRKDPSNVVVHYYLASALMQIGATDKASAEFDKVISLNTVPGLTSYSIQAKNCLSGTGKCEYVKLNSEQIPNLISDPQNYINALKEKTLNGAVSPDNQEIDKLINGKYGSNIHPDAKRVIIDTLLKQEKHDMNVSTEKIKSEAITTDKVAEAPTNDQIAEAVKVLAKAGLNPLQQANATFNPYANLNQNSDYASLNMMLGNGQQGNNNGNNFMNMLPFIMQQSQSGNKQMTSEMVQAMMTSQMMPDFGYDSNPKY